MEKLISLINEIREEKGLEKVNDVTSETDLRIDLGFDSFDLALLTAQLEDEYSIDVFEGGVVRTVGEILQKLEK